MQTRSASRGSQYIRGTRPARPAQGQSPGALAQPPPGPEPVFDINRPFRYYSSRLNNGQLNTDNGGPLNTTDNGPLSGNGGKYQAYSPTVYTADMSEDEPVYLPALGTFKPLHALADAQVVRDVKLQRAYPHRTMTLDNVSGNRAMAMDHLHGRAASYAPHGDAMHRHSVHRSMTMDPRDSSMDIRHANRSMTMDHTNSTMDGRHTVNRSLTMDHSRDSSMDVRHAVNRSMTMDHSRDSSMDIRHPNRSMTMDHNSMDYRDSRADHVTSNRAHSMTVGTRSYLMDQSRAHSMTAGCIPDVQDKPTRSVSVAPRPVSHAPATLAQRSFSTATARPLSVAYRPPVPASVPASVPAAVSVPVSVPGPYSHPAQASASTSSLDRRPAAPAMPSRPASVAARSRSYHSSASPSFEDQQQQAHQQRRQPQPRFYASLRASVLIPDPIQTATVEEETTTIRKRQSVCHQGPSRHSIYGIQPQPQLPSQSQTKLPRSRLATTAGGTEDSDSSASPSPVHESTVSLSCPSLLPPVLPGSASASASSLSIDGGKAQSAAEAQRRLIKRNPSAPVPAPFANIRSNSMPSAAVSPPPLPRAMSVMLPARSPSVSASPAKGVKKRRLASFFGGLFKR